jgi:hypothetical protein
MNRTRRPSEAAPHRPLYARMLRLRYLTPSGLLCFVFFEGAVALGLLLGLAELVSWWGVLVLPAMVALMVKLNDVVTGSLARAATPGRSPGPARPGLSERSGLDLDVGGPATAATAGPAVAMNMAGESTTRLPGVIEREQGAPVKRPWAERVEVQQQWMRQSANRRYE